MYFLYQLITIADQILNGSNNIQIKTYRLLPSIEDLQIHTIDNKNTSNECPSTEEVNLNRKKINSDNATAIIHHQLSAIQTKKIVDICHFNNVSVHSYLCAALSEALFECKNYNFDKLMCLSPINMRPYLPLNVDPDDMGYLLSRVDFCVFNEPNLDILERAKAMNRQIKQFIDLDMHKEILHNMRDLFSLYFANKDFHKRIQLNAPGLLVSNIGRVNFHSMLSSIIVENMHFALACHGILGNENSMAATITTFNNQMNINFHYIEPWTSVDEAKHFADLTLKKII